MPAFPRRISEVEKETELIGLTNGEGFSQIPSDKDKWLHMSGITLCECV